MLSRITVLLLVLSPGLGMLRRCFNCRSRGPLGDCRDPFYLTGNSTTLEHKSHGVKTSPCASGWCSKILEDVDKAYAIGLVSHQRLISELAARWLLRHVCYD